MAKFPVVKREYADGLRYKVLRWGEFGEFGVIEYTPGSRAGRVGQEGQTEVWARPMLDGTTAVGLFNRGTSPAAVKVTWDALKLQGPSTCETSGNRRTPASFPKPTKQPSCGTAPCW